MSKENLWKDAEHQLKELDLDLEDDGGNNQWDAAATQEVSREPEPRSRRALPTPPPGG